MTTTWELPDALVGVLTDSPDVAKDTLTEVLAQAYVLTQGATVGGRSADGAVGTHLSVIAAWCCYQSLICTSGDLVEQWLDRLATCAVVLAGDAMTLALPHPEAL